MQLPWLLCNAALRYYSMKNSTKLVLPRLELARTSPAWECKQNKSVYACPYRYTVRDSCLPKLWAGHKADTSFLFACISLLGSSALYYLAAVIKLLFHLLRLLQPLPCWGTGNFGHTHNGNCSIMATACLKRLTYCHWHRKTGTLCARSTLFTPRSHQLV